MITEGSAEAVAVIQDVKRSVSPGAPEAPAIAAQLDRILTSAEFRKSARMCRFLRLVTQEALTGNSASLKEYRIGTEVFDKEDSFDPRVDPIVRNEARRLRRKLVTYYLVEGKSDPVLIELPKGGYAPVFALRPVAFEDDPALQSARGRSRRWRFTALGGALAALTLAAWWTVGQRPVRPESNAAAREAYLLGKHLLFNLRVADMPASRSQLETAVRLNPAFPEALAALALNHQTSVIFGLTTRETGMAKSLELAAKAASVAPGSAAAEFALAGDVAVLREDYAAAEQHFRRALAREPSDAATHASYALTCLLQLGRVDDARREAQKGWGLARNGLTMTALALTDYCARDYQAAILHAQAELQGQSPADPVIGVLIDAYLAIKKWDEAWFFIEKNGFDLDRYHALIRALKGDGQEALQLAKKRAVAAGPPLVTARLFAAAGDAASAIHWIEEADRRHDFSARIFPRYSPDFEVARNSSEFASVLEAMSHPRQP